jgi:hypothetical protein
MITDATALRLRLSFACGCFVALGFVYIQALARGRLLGTYSSFSHPWGGIGSDILIFGLCSVSIVLLRPFVRQGSRPQRVCALVLAILPVLVVGHFFAWLFD